MKNISLSQFVIKYQQINYVKKIWFTIKQSYTDGKLSTYVKKNQYQYIVKNVDHRKSLCTYKFRFPVIGCKLKQADLGTTLEKIDYVLNVILAVQIKLIVLLHVENMINKEKKILQLGLNKSKFPEFSALDNDQKLFFSEIWLFNY